VEKLNAEQQQAADVFDSFDKDKKGELGVDLIETILEELGENFHGDELDKIVKICSNDSGEIDRKLFYEWYEGVINGGDDDNSLDSEEMAEREEEREKAIEAFDSMMDESSNMIKVEQFGEVLVKMGSTYCEEEHVRTLKNIAIDGQIERATFLDWYVEWLFGDNADDSYSDTEYNAKNGDGGDDGEQEEEAAVSSEGGGGGGWGGAFASNEKKWKCEVCMCSNSEEKNKMKCPACETARPGFEEENEAAKKAFADAAQANAVPVKREQV